MKSKILAIFFASLSVMLLILLVLSMNKSSLITFKTMCDDLNKRVTSQEDYIKDLEWENNRYIMCCENN